MFSEAPIRPILMLVRYRLIGKNLKIEIHIMLKSGVLDPQGKAIERALGSLGFEGINDVRHGKFIELELSETNKERAKAEAEDMCRKLLANTVIEDYRIDIR